MQTDTNIAIAREAAARSLRLALTRYERLAARPRWLDRPLVGDIDGYIRAERRARTSGNTARADELLTAIEREYERQDLRDAWSGRSRKAWAACCERLARAVEWSIRVGAIQGDMAVYCCDRLHDAQNHVKRHDVEARINALN